MRTLMYGLGYIALIPSALAMAMLPRLAPSRVLFVIAGALLTLLITGGWALLTASAGEWFRPRTGWVLMAAAGVAGLAALMAAHWNDLFWAGGVFLAGVAFALRPRPRVAPEEREPRPVRGPLSRREEL